jgi:hypothetical protein
MAMKWKKWFNRAEREWIWEGFDETDGARAWVWKYENEDFYRVDGSGVLPDRFPTLKDAKHEAILRESGYIRRR